MTTVSFNGLFIVCLVAVAAPVLVHAVRWLKIPAVVLEIVVGIAMDRPPTAESRRLADAAAADRWRSWGPYLAERAWGTVGEDHSEHGTAWEHFSHDDARSRAYRWNDDGLGFICDLCRRSPRT